MTIGSLRDKLLHKQPAEAPYASADSPAQLRRQILLPLHGILGFTELALGRNISCAVKEEYLKKIKNSAEDLLAITGGLTEAAPLELDEKYERPIFTGQVLLCEDQEISAQVLRDHLERVGLQCTMAPSAAQALDIVKARQDRPFDLIFVNIDLPLAELGPAAPIVALSAPGAQQDREDTIAAYLPIPFRTRELWACLLKYLTPVDIKPLDTDEQTADYNKQSNLFLTGFVRDNQNTFQEILLAVKTGDTAQALELVHRLNGLAGLIGHSRLRLAAQAVETALEGGDTQVGSEQLHALAYELNLTLGELSYLLHQPHQKSPASPPDEQQARQLLNRLEELLQNHDADCLDLLDELRAMPGTKTLAEQVEDYDFRQALQSLATLKQDLGW